MTSKGKSIHRPRAAARTCEACGKQYRTWGKRFCSHKCEGNARRQSAHHNWNASGRSVTHTGYVLVRTGVGCTGRRIGWQYEHVAVAERALGRPLKRGEVVHHINGDKTDNRNSNLLICTHAYHGLLHTRMAQAWQREHLKSA